MAKLSDETLTNIFTLQRQLIEGIDAAAAIELAILKQFGETEITIPALEELQNAKERQTEPYSRLCTLLLRVAESQPNAARDMLDLLYQTIVGGQATVEATAASIREVKQDFDLP